MRYAVLVIGSRNPLVALAAALLLVASASEVGAQDVVRAEIEGGTVAANVAANANVAAKKARGRLKVRKIRPRAGRTFVPLDVTVRIRFSRPVDPETISEFTVQFRRLLGEDVSYNLTLEKNNKLIVLTPTGFLDPGKDYEVVVRFGLASDKGRLLKREARAIFFTDATVPPFQFLRPEQFVPIASEMFEGRAAHTATRLDDGSILVAGGMADAARVSDTGELFDTTELEFRAAGSRLLHARAYHEAVPISGSAMLIGGWTGLTADSTTELFDPLTREFRVGPEMIEERDFMAAVTLNDGRVLVVGGLRYVGTGAVFSQTAEIYDPSLGGFRETRQAPLARRAGHRLTVLNDGRVLITGGLPQGSSAVSVAEIFDPARESFVPTGTPSLGFRQLHTATKLSGGAVLLADGGNPKMELYDPGTDRFFEAGGASFARRTRSTASLLSGDRVLIVGGFDQQGENTLILETMDLYLPHLGGGLGRVVRPDVVLPAPRAGHTALGIDDYIFRADQLGLQERRQS